MLLILCVNFFKTKSNCSFIHPCFYLYKLLGGFHFKPNSSFNFRKKQTVSKQWTQTPDEINRVNKFWQYSTHNPSYNLQIWAITILQVYCRLHNDRIINMHNHEFNHFVCHKLCVKSSSFGNWCKNVCVGVTPKPESRVLGW